MAGWSWRAASRACGTWRNTTSRSWPWTVRQARIRRSSVRRTLRGSPGRLRSISSSTAAGRMPRAAERRRSRRSALARGSGRRRWRGSFFCDGSRGSCSTGDASMRTVRPKAELCLATRSDCSCSRSRVIARSPRGLTWSRCIATCRRYPDQAICSSLQIGSTPCVSRCLSMKFFRTSVGGRAPPARKKHSPASGFVRPAQLFVLTFEFLQACRSPVWIPALAPASTRRARPFMQGLRHAAVLASNGLNGADSEGYSARCSCTMRTARSRTSGENLFDFFMAQSSQNVEPPSNSGRFTADSRQRLASFPCFRAPGYFLMFAPTNSLQPDA
jgi:hypothetical protein